MKESDFDKYYVFFILLVLITYSIAQLIYLSRPHTSIKPIEVKYEIYINGELYDPNASGMNDDTWYDIIEVWNYKKDTVNTWVGLKWFKFTDRYVIPSLKPGDTSIIRIPNYPGDTVLK